MKTENIPGRLRLPENGPVVYTILLASPLPSKQVHYRKCRGTETSVGKDYVAGLMIIHRTTKGISPLPE